MMPKRGHYDSWHSDIDLKTERMVAMSINLSPRIYRGGSLQIRYKKSKKIIQEITNIGLGDAIIFRVDPRLEHRVTDLKGKEAKTAFAGWFQMNPKCIFDLKDKTEKRSLFRIRSRISRLTVDSKINPASDVAFVKEGTHTAVFNLKNGLYYKLDPVGSRIWDLMRETHSPRSIIQTLSTEYDVDSKQIKKDTLHLVRDLHNKGLIKSKTRSSSS